MRFVPGVLSKAHCGGVRLSRNSAEAPQHVAKTSTCICTAAVLKTSVHDLVKGERKIAGRKKQ